MRHQLKDTGIEVIELAPPGVQTDLMPGHAENPQMMPLDDYIAEVMGLLRQQPALEEICVERVKFLREAERRGDFDQVFEIGRASCRERVCQYVSISVVDVSLKKKKNK